MRIPSGMKRENFQTCLLHYYQMDEERNIALIFNFKLTAAYEPKPKTIDKFNYGLNTEVAQSMSFKLTGSTLRIVR